jgi:flagellar hook capping protein FlgD
MKKLLFTFFVLVFAVSSYSTTVYDIQYTTEAGPDGTYPSPMADQEVTVTGIVIGANYNNLGRFFLSDPEGGPWTGVYVYDSEGAPALGDEVVVTATVSEYYGLTELGYCTVTILSSGNTIPEPADVTTLSLVVAAQAEQYEGCLVRVTDVEVIEAQDSYGQWYVDDGSLECQIDDGFFYLDSVTPPIEIELGMQWASITGCLDYSFDEYGINPRTPDDLVAPSGFDENEIPDQPITMSNFPNPFNPETTITYEIRESDNIELSIFGINGQKIKTLIKSKRPSGRHIIMWDGTDDAGLKVTSGIYFYKLTTNAGYSNTKKMILLK